MDELTLKERIAIFQQFIDEKMEDLTDFGAKGMCALSFMQDGKRLNLMTFLGVPDNETSAEVIKDICESLYSQTEEDNTENVTIFKVVMLTVAAMILADNPQMERAFNDILQKKRIVNEINKNN